MGLGRVWQLNPLILGTCNLRPEIHVQSKKQPKPATTTQPGTLPKEEASGLQHHGHESWEILAEVFGQESCLPLRLEERNPLSVPTEESLQPDSGWEEVGEL